MEEEAGDHGLCYSASPLFVSRLYVYLGAWEGLVVVILRPSPPSHKSPTVRILMAPGDKTFVGPELPSLGSPWSCPGS